jgi:drug/metabolite transporter (DMT)-like permease
VNSPRLIGIALVLISATIFSSAGLFVKGVEAAAWSIIFWRGLFAALFTFAYVAWRGGIRKEFSGMGRTGVAAAVVGASGTIAFIPSFKFTTIANVSLIYAAAPFVAAAIAWVWLRERPTKVVLISSLVAFTGVLLVVGGSLGSLHLRGDLLALWMTIAMSLYMCIYRRYPDTPAAGPAALMSVFLVPLGFIFGDPMAASYKEIFIMASFGLVFSVASVTLAEGARRLPASETALISAIETPLAPFWAFLLFMEYPAASTITGGIIILIAVFGSLLYPKLCSKQI